VRSSIFPSLSVLVLLGASEVVAPDSSSLAQGGVIIGVVAILSKVIYDIIRDMRGNQSGNGNGSMRELYQRINMLSDRLSRLEGVTEERHRRNSE